MYRKPLYLLLIYLCLGRFMACAGRNTQAPPHTIPPGKDSSMVYIQNERIRLGVNVTIGGAVTYLSDKANGGENMINSFDWGRQIQMSFYSGSWPYIEPNGERPAPEWDGLGWNPIQSGDTGGNHSKVIFYDKRGDNAIFDGIGVFQPEVMNFNGGFHPNDGFKGYGREKDGQTGHIAPVGKQIIDHNIHWTYKTSFILGTLDDIRSYVKENRTARPNSEWSFENSRCNWYYQGKIKDMGFPIQGELNIQFEKNAILISPLTFWQASESPFLKIEGDFTSEKGKELELVVEIRPVSKSDFTDWLNWSEGEFSIEKEKEIKAPIFSIKPSLTVKQTIVSDGYPHKHQIDLSSIPDYQGAMKEIKISFSGAGRISITRIHL